MDRPATIKDIARELNLSVSTVSRAMRDAPDVSVKTREAVLALSEKLKYHPSRLALSLKDKQTHNIGVLVPNLDYVISTMVKGIDEVALEAGYTVLVCQSNESFGREMVNARRLQDSLVDGFIISVSSETKSFDHIRKIQEKNLPTVIFDRFIPEIEAPSVRIDNPDGGLQATQHLIDQGYKRIAIIAGPKNLGISNSRMEGYLLALKKNKIGHDPSLIIHCNFNQQDAFQATMQLLAMKKRPDAIFTISDRMAIGAFLAIKEKGLKMPKDIGLVGFNNEPITALVTPGISSVEQPSFELGKLAAKLFIETAHNSDNIQQTENILPVKLIIRESSMRKKILTLLPLLLVLGMFCEARKIKVSTQVALTSAAASARPGDTILLKTGEWKNAVIELRCQGTEKNPVVIKAETNGKVWFTGVSSIHLGGSFIVAEGFNFVNGYAGKTAVMEFKAGKDLANNCRITQCTIDDF
ncbi:MAG: substrate-binding domain-containing protein, partial [Gemmatimonadaceae bacterium]|nr:substrate-binding domain-containing protein [Chitinophagaceae bacterium]